MNRNKLFPVVWALSLMGLVLAPSLAAAKLRYNGPHTNASGTYIVIYGSYNFSCEDVVTKWPCIDPQKTLFQAPAVPNFYSPVTCAPSPDLIPSPCDGSHATAQASFPAAVDGDPFAYGRIIGLGGAGVVGGGPEIAAAPQPIVTDSMSVGVTRNVVNNTITLRINGRARHESATGDGLVSKLKIVIYQDSTSAKNEVNPISGGTGEIRFIGTNKTVVSGFINSGDVTTTDNGNVHQLTTAANLSKVIAIPSNFINTATVSVEI